MLSAPKRDQGDEEVTLPQNDHIQIEEDQDVAEPQAPCDEYHTLDCRSFWRVGSHDAFSTPFHSLRDELEHSDFERARVHPMFLHSNATSHKWVFGAIAELLDNAVDEICNGATFVKVDRVFNKKDTSSALLFQDDGGGMDPEGIRRCMSLGFSSKKTIKTIGQYGNGFKTSTMRLGSDAIVFSRSVRGSRVTESVGLLSYTFLTRTMKNDIIVPMVDFEIVEDDAIPIVFGSQSDWDNSLKIILDWSPFSTKRELLMQFEDIGSHGTKVFVYNLWHDDDGMLELDFDDDDEDIRLRERAKGGAMGKARNDIVQSHISFTSSYSLRAYASILYLRKFSRFSIILRGKPVQQLDLSTEMKFTKMVRYRPYVGKDDSVKATIGFTKEAPLLGTYGLNIYHKNRLIKPFWKAHEVSGVRGKCVIGMLETNFIEPAHDKQDFERSSLFNRLESRLKQIILEYWKTHCHLIGYKSQCAAVLEKQKQSDKTFIVPAPAMPSGQEDSGQPIICGAANFQMELPSIEHDTALDNSAVSGFLPSLQYEVPYCIKESTELADGLTEENPDTNSLDSTSIEKIGEDNIMLFMKREEYRFREAELKQVIGKLENELDEVKKKCARLASDIEIRRKYGKSGQ